MALDPIHYAAFKADIAANTNTVSYAGATVQIKDLPNDNGANSVIADWYGTTASPSFTVLRLIADNFALGTSATLTGGILVYGPICIEAVDVVTALLGVVEISNPWVQAAEATSPWIDQQQTECD